MARGNNREPVVHDEYDVKVFLDSLQVTCERYAWRVFGWCVMPNHYHMVLETAHESLSNGMRRHNSVYAQLFNRRHNRVGHVFQGRFKALLVADERYLMTVLRYVEINPCRAALASHPAEWPWSSVHVSLGQKPAPQWSAVRDVWARFGATEAEGIQGYRGFLLNGMQSISTELPIQDSLIIGDEAAATKVRARVDRRRASTEIPKNQQSPLPPLADVFSRQRDIDIAIRDAYAAGFPLRAIADYVGIHYSAVSVIARRTRPRKRGSIALLKAASRLSGATVAP